VVVIARGNRPAVWLLVCVVIAVPWFAVARQLNNARPAAQSNIAPTAVVWGGRVFTSPATLDFWLRNRGASYGHWASLHSDASAVIEPGRPAVAKSHRSAARSAPKAGSKRRVGHTSAVFRPPVLAPSLKLAIRTAPNAESARQVDHASALPKPAVHAPPRAHVSLAQRIGEIALLLLSGFAIAVGFAPPAQLRRVVSMSAPTEFRIAAVAAGITIAVVVATFSYIG
jgi:hypothetical protein